MSDAGIRSVAGASEKYPPPGDFSAKAHIVSLADYERMYRRSIEQPEAFWGEVAADFHFYKKWDRVLDWQPPFAKWFAGGTTNISYNCLERQIARGRGNHTAILWQGEPVGAGGQPKDIRRISYQQLLSEVCRFANALRTLGVKSGDRVTLYMPMVPERVIPMLACARIGAPHSVIFAGFSAQAIADRLVDAQSHFVITADGGWRRGTIVPLKANVDEACKLTGLVQKVVVLRRCENEIAWSP